MNTYSRLRIKISEIFSTFVQEIESETKNLNNLFDCHFFVQLHVSALGKIAVDSE